MTAQQAPQRAYTVQQASAAYGVSADVIRAHIKAGSLTARYPTSRPIIEAKVLDAWLEALPEDAPSK